MLATGKVVNKHAKARVLTIRANRAKVATPP